MPKDKPKPLLAPALGRRLAKQLLQTSKLQALQCQSGPSGPTAAPPGTSSRLQPPSHVTGESAA